MAGSDRRYAQLVEDMLAEAPEDVSLLTWLGRAAMERRR
jgi:hypothetical protein